MYAIGNISDKSGRIYKLSDSLYPIGTNALIPQTYEPINNDLYEVLIHDIITYIDNVKPKIIHNQATTLSIRQMWLIIENTTTIEVALDSLSRIIVIIDITATHITVTIDRFRLQTIEILTYTSEKFIKIIDDLINTKLASTILLTASK
jgi:hypothetical protein